MKSWRINVTNAVATLVAATVSFSPASVTADVSGAATEPPGIHNFLRATDHVFSGSQPEGDEAFAALAKLGVKTLVSVDGAKPNVELAARHGLRYVHLPFGYDGIPTNRALELVRAADVLPGPIYVHCHHGKHRGPAAVGIICRGSEGWTAERAGAFMREAGTAPEYTGLYRVVNEFTRPTAAELSAVSTNFPAVALTSSLIDAMVAIDVHLEHLKAAQKSGWQAPSGHPDIAPAHEALLLLEQLRELSRAEDAAARPEDYRVKLAAASHAADELHAKLKNSAAVAADPALKRVTQSCVDCHRRHRNS